MGDPTPNLNPDSNEDRFDRIDALVSLLVDEAISETEVQELEALLLAEEGMRLRYIGGMQLHADLMDHYSPSQQNATATATSPILTMLGKPMPGAPEESGIHLSVQPPKGNE